MFQRPSVGILSETSAAESGKGSRPQRRRCRPNSEESLTYVRLAQSNAILCIV